MVSVLLLADGALTVICPVYTLDGKPVGSTVTATVFKSPISVMFPVGVTVSQLAVFTLTVAVSAEPLLVSTSALVSEGAGIGSPVV